MEEIIKYKVMKMAFCRPNLFDNVTKDMTIYKEEIFGPVVSVVRAKNYDEAINLVNNHSLAMALIYTSDGEISRHFTTNAKIGMVGVNVPIPVPMAFHSFGLETIIVWRSFVWNGRNTFLYKIKTVTSRWPKSIQSGPEFVLPTN